MPESGEVTASKSWYSLELTHPDLPRGMDLLLQQVFGEDEDPHHVSSDCLQLKVLIPRGSEGSRVSVRGQSASLAVKPAILIQFDGTMQAS